MPSYIGALDQGTTSTRFIVFDRTGQIVSTAQKEHRQIYPRPGWVEHNPREILDRTIEVINEATVSSNLGPKDLACIGITNQRETTVVWNKSDGLPVCNALVWQDARVSDHVARLTLDGGRDRFRAQTGLPLSTYFSALKITWILDHIRDARRQAEEGQLLFGNIDSYLLWNLTGGAESGIHITDVTNASRTQLMNIETLDWDPELLRIFNVPRSMLPEIRSSSEYYGDLKVTVLAGLPITGILGDQHAALVGQTCFRPGEVKNTYGTGCFLLMNTGPKRIDSRRGLLTTVAYRFGKQPPVYALEGSIAVAGTLVQWMRDNLGLIAKNEEIETLARTVVDNGGVFFVPAFSGLYAPHWQEGARGLMAGLTGYANKGHIARAALEAIAYQTRELVDAMEADSGISLMHLRADGGMVTNELLMQFQADVLNRNVIRSEMNETTALGAAYAAGLACGFYRDFDDLVVDRSADRVWKPQMDEGERRRLISQWSKAVTRSFEWID